MIFKIEIPVHVEKPQKDEKGEDAFQMKDLVMQDSCPGCGESPNKETKKLLHAGDCWVLIGYVWATRKRE